MPNSNPTTLLADTRATVARWDGWERVRSLRESSGSAYAFRADARGKRVVCVCKRSLFEGLASFMRRVVEHDAVRLEADALVEFVGDTPTYDTAWAFDPATVRARGRASEGASVKRDGVEWLELNARDFGIRLGRYVVGGEALPAPEPPSERQSQLPLEP